MRTPEDMVHSTYEHIKSMISRTNDKGDMTYDR